MAYIYIFNTEKGYGNIIKKVNVHSLQNSFRGNEWRILFQSLPFLKRAVRLFRMNQATGERRCAIWRFCHASSKDDKNWVQASFLLLNHWICWELNKRENRNISFSYASRKIKIKKKKREHRRNLLVCRKRKLSALHSLD